MTLLRLFKMVLSIFLTVSIWNECAGQQSDFIVLKKKNKILKSYFSGSQIQFIANDAFYSGTISKVDKDSIFIIQYDIRKVPTNLGVYMMDTISALQYPVYFKEVTQIIKNRKGFDWGASGASLFGGGVLISAVGMATWLFTKQDSRYYAGTKLVGGAALAAAAGFVLLKSNKSTYAINRKVTLHYIPAKN